jgi:hypothetical protein
MRHALAISGRLVAAILLSCALLAAAPQEASLGSIFGRVFNSGGYAVPNALVVLQYADGSGPRSTQADNQGRFAFRKLYDGLYEIRASAQGRSTEWMHNVSVFGGHQTNIILHLQNDPRRPVKPRATSSPR